LTLTSTDEKNWSVIEKHNNEKKRNEKSLFYHSETLFSLQFNDPDWSPLGEPPPPVVYVSVRFGSVLVSSVCYRPGLVYVRFWFLWFLVEFVWCLECFALIFVFLASKNYIQITSPKRFIASHKRFYEQRLLKSDGKNWIRKIKISWNY
jgi:hypothetical protein